MHVAKFDSTKDLKQSLFCCSLVNSFRIVFQILQNSVIDELEYQI